jgi:hypothetical protein
MANRLSGGGITMNKNVKGNVRAGPASTNKVSPAGVSQLGYATGDKLKGEGSHTGINTAQKVFQGTAPQVRSGNDVAASTVAGPGGSRTVLRSGGQGVHGPVIPDNRPPARNVWNEYVPSKK